MQKRILIIVIIIGVLSGAGFLLSRSQDSPKTESITTSSNAQPPAQPSPTATQTAGKYVSYSESALAEADGTRILFFHASWCPQCRAIEADIQKQGVPAGTTILKVDYDNAQQLRKKYGVTLQTTVVKVDSQGNLISKFTPYQKPTLDNALSNL